MRTSSRSPEQLRAAARRAGRAARDRARRARGSRCALEARRAARAARRGPRRRSPRSARRRRHARASHALGKSYARRRQRLSRALRAPARLRRAPARRGTTSSACSSGARRERVAAIPYGGGTSVVGGVTPDVGPRLQRRGLDRPRRARPRARGRRGLARGAHPGGGAGPALEAQLREHGLTLRHFPQSFEFSTLGGWIATRAGGHFATRLDAHRGPRGVGARDHAGRALGVAAAARVGRRRRAPTGCSRARRAALGVITERVGARAAAARAPPLGGRPLRRASLRGAECVRALAQSGLHPSNCRLLDAGEAALDDGRRRHARAARARLRVRPTIPSTRAMERALAICAEHGGSARRGAARRGRRTPSARGARRSSARPTCATCSSRWACSRRPSRRRSRGSASPRFHERVRRAGAGGGARGVRRGRARVLPLHARLPRRAGALLHGDRARRGAARSSSSGRRSSARPPTRSSPRAARSPITTPSGATTGRGTTASVPSRSPRRCAAAKAAVDPAGVMNPGVLLERAVRMRIAVLGPGGVGGLLAGALDRAGSEVTVVAREPTARADRRAGDRA